MASATMIALKATGWVSEDMLGWFLCNVLQLLPYDSVDPPCTDILFRQQNQL